MVVSRLGEIRFIDPNTDIVLSTLDLPYGSILYNKHGDIVKQGDLIAKWDPFNALIVTEYAGTLRFNDVIDGVTSVPYARWRGCGHSTWHRYRAYSHR